MDWEDIRHAWQSRPAPGRGEFSLPDEAGRLRRTIRRRDLMETVVALFLALFFGANVWFLWIGGFETAAAFSLWLSIACITIPIRLRNGRKRFPARESDLPLRAFLQQERAALAHQRHLLGTVLWWYLGPIMIGVLGFFIGIRGLHWHSLAYAAFVLLIGFGIERANRLAVRTRIEPAIRAIDEQIRQLEEDNDD